MILVEEEGGPESMVRGNLTIRYLTRDDFAMYTCRGDTEAGIGEQNFRLGPDGPIILDERKSTTDQRQNFLKCSP